MYSFDCSPCFTVSTNSGREVDGDLRLNYNTLEVYCGGCWTAVDTSIDVQLTPESQEILKWARQKMKEEQRLDELCERYPALKTAKDKYEVIKAIVEND